MILVASHKSENIIGNEKNAGTIIFSFLNQITNDKFSEVTKFKAFLDDKINIAKTTIFFSPLL